MTLSHLAFTRAAWSLRSLKPFHEAYGSIRKYITISPLMRIDVLLTFVSVNAFHLTLSPHVGPRISPLATKWMVKYGPWMEKIILEVDMTKFGLGGVDGSDMLYPGLDNVLKLVKDFAASQGNRKVPLKELTLLCRRYYGERVKHRSEPTSTRLSYTSAESNCSSNGSSNQTSNSAGTTSSNYSSNDSSNGSSEQSSNGSHEHCETPSPPEEGNKASKLSNGSTNSNPSVTSSFTSGDTNPNTRTPSPHSLPTRSPSPPKPKLYYCPNYHLPLLNHLYQPLHTKVHALRMCGFSEKYTHLLIKAMFPAASGRCVFRLGPSNGAWPRLVGQRSWIDDGTGEAMIDVVEEDDDATGFGWMGSDMPPRPVRDENGGLSLPGSAPCRSDDRTPASSRSEKTRSSGSSGKTMSKGKRLKKFLAGAGGKADSIRDGGSSKDSKEGKMALMNELPGYI